MIPQEDKNTKTNEEEKTMQDTAEEELKEEQELIQEVDEAAGTDEEAAPDENHEDELKKLADEVAELKDKYTRLYADVENYKKRAAKDKSSAVEYAKVPVFEKMLPVLDNFDRSLNSGTPGDPFYDGVALVSRQLREILSAEGLTEIESIGKPFDPVMMNAVMTDNDEEQDEDIVTEELQKGYQYKDRVVRPSMVKVNKH